MINVLISEDELLVRMGILSMINWEGMGMKVVSCVSDGLAALSDALKLRPDIVITDIVMPGMDGISLLGTLRGEGLHPTCIVITALHQRQAMERAEELGIVACLVKATMTQRDIMAALMAACAHIEDKGAGESGGADEKRLAEQYHALLAGSCEEEPPRAAAYAMCRARAGAALDGVLGQTIGQLILEIFPGCGPSVFAAHGDSILTAFQNPLARPRGEAMDALMELKRYIERNLAIMPDFAILNNAPAHMGSAACVGFMLRALDGICYVPGVLWTDGGELSAPAMPADERKAYIEECLALLWAMHDICAIYSAWRALSELGSADDAYEQLGALNSLAKAVGAPISADTGAAREACLNALRARTSGDAYRREIGSAIGFVLSNLNREVKLSEAAGMAGFHEVYFSSLLKQQLGMCFSQFCTSIRMEHAKRLLCEGPHTTSQVSEMCGYRDIAYFCRVFKQNVGVTPAAWRDTH